MLNKIRELILTTALVVNEFLPIILSVALISAATISYLMITKPRNYNDSIVMVLSDKPAFSGGSGFIATNKNGNDYIVTSEHVCDPRSSVGEKFIIKHNGINYTASVLKVDKYSDLCILSKPKALVSNALRVASEVNLFQSVKIEGFPHLTQRVRLDAIITNTEEPTEFEVDVDPNTGVCPPGATTTVAFPGLILSCVQEHAPTLRINRPMPTGISGSPVTALNGDVVGVVSMTDSVNSYASHVNKLRELLNSLP